jgi:hypothetical protein
MDINELLPDDEIVTPEQLYEDVSCIREVMKLNWIESFVFFCEKNNYDIDNLTKIIPPSLKLAIEEEAISLHLLKKDKRRLNRLDV